MIRGLWDRQFDAIIDVKIGDADVYTYKYKTMKALLLVGNGLFLNVFKILEKKYMRYILKKIWNVAETCREIEDMTLYLIHI